MSILMILGIVLLVGFGTWVVTVAIPMAPPIGRIFVGLVVILLALWILEQFHVVNWFPNMRIR